MVDIVICDDEVILRNGLKSWVERSGLPLHVSGTAGNGLQALELIAQQKPFIALMDINMPGMPGLDVIEEVQKRGIGTRFIIISGHDEFQYARRACHLNVVDYLLKPIDRGELMELLKKVLEQIRKEQLTQKVFVEKEDTTKEKILGTRGISRRILQSSSFLWASWQMRFICPSRMLQGLLNRRQEVLFRSF